MMDVQANEYRRILMRILDHHEKHDEVMALFERNLEVEADDGRAAAYQALRDAGLSRYTISIDEAADNLQ